MAVIQPLVQDEEASVRRILAEQLGLVEGSESAAFLAQLAGDTDKDVRVTALTALVDGGGPGIESTLLAAVNDEDYEVSTLALNGLARVSQADVAPQLAPLLESQNPYVALSAAHAILAAKERGGAEATG